jgi:hypothetical protein
VVEHVDGTVSPNPSETAWLAAVLLNDDKVAAVAAVLKEARTAARKRTRDDWIAFEMMREACGGRHGLARATALKEKHLSDLSQQLQVERHRAGYVPTPPDFNPNQLHREVHDLFLRWARSRFS